MRAKIVRIGNSQGVRIPKPLLEQAALGTDVELTVADRTIVIARAAPPRAGWSAAFAAMADAGDDALLDEPIPTAFDEASWHW
jgi:antitoxin MazE